MHGNSRSSVCLCLRPVEKGRSQKIITRIASGDFSPGHRLKQTLLRMFSSLILLDVKHSQNHPLFHNPAELPQSSAIDRDEVATLSVIS